MADYKEQENGFVKRLSDGAIIPNHPGNAERQAYERWLEEGGVPEPYVPPPPLNPEPMLSVSKADFDALVAEVKALKAKL